MKQGWQIKKLGSLCSFERGLTYSKGDEAAFSNKGVLRSNNVDLASNTLNFGEIKYLKEDIDIPVSKKVKRNSLLMCMSNGSKAHLGKVAIIEDDLDYAFGGFMGLLIPNEEIVFPRYFYYALITPMYKLYIKGLSDGANINNLKFADLKEFDIPVPPLSEQHRIVSLLDAEFAKIDALKANAERNLQNAKDLFQAALKKELEPKEGWKKKTIKDVCSVFGRIGYRGYTRNDLVDNAVDGAITLSPSNIVDNEMVYDKVTYISWFKYEESPEIMIFDDDILLVKTGSSYGKCALVRNLPHKATINPQFVVLKNININRRFLNYYLRTPYSKARFDEFVSGTAIPTFSQANLGNMTITFPSMEDQQSIVSRLDTLNEKCKALQANYEKTLSLCDDLKQALLTKAFNGEL